MTDTEEQLPVLVHSDDPILRKRARELTDRERAHIVGPLIAELQEVMHAHAGAGLAAPQIGKGLRVFVAGDDYFVNPLIVWRSAESDVQEEGCLSLPGVIIPVRRNLHITLHTAGRNMSLSGMPARIAQHEIDHLDGKLITDYRGVVPSAPSLLLLSEAIGIWNRMRVIDDALPNDRVVAKVREILSDYGLARVDLGGVAPAEDLP